jgi:hypothetical protein
MSIGTDDRRELTFALEDVFRSFRSELVGLSGARAGKALATLIGDRRAELVQISKNGRKEDGYRPTQN